MKFREFYREAVETGKCLAGWAALAGAFLAVGYAREQSRTYHDKRGAALVIMIAGSQGKDSKGGTIEIKEIRYGESKLEKGASEEVLVEKRK